MSLWNSFIDLYARWCIEVTHDTRWTRAYVARNIVYAVHKWRVSLWKHNLWDLWEIYLPSSHTHIKCDNHKSVNLLLKSINLLLKNILLYVYIKEFSNSRMMDHECKKFNNNFKNYISNMYKLVYISNNRIYRSRDLLQS